MAAPLGFKTFATGDVLTAADTNGYLMQGVWTFANAAARTAAVTSPQEGNVSFLKDTNSLEIYDGASWVAYGSGDITGVTAGTGISGGGTSGDVTITNSMATAIDAKGDLIAGTGADAFARLAVGTNGQALLADSTTATGLKWGSASPSYTWTSFTPSFFQSAALSLSSNTSKYTSVGDIGFLFINVIFSSAGTANNLLYFTIPAGPITPDGTQMLGGWVNIYDASAVTRYNGAAEVGGTYFYFQSGVNKANATINWGQTGSDFPIAIASGDSLSAFITYKKA
jgi:hypothetical protein